LPQPRHRIRISQGNQPFGYIISSRRGRRRFAFGHEGIFKIFGRLGVNGHSLWHQNLFLTAANEGQRR
jgi:hypothetical protein